MVPVKPASGPVRQPDTTITVLIVDDQPIVRYGICHLVNSQVDIEIAASAADCATAWKILDDTQPHVLLMDVQLKDRCAHKLIEQVSQSRFGTRMLVYTSQSAEWPVLEAIRSGVHGYITKDADPERLCDAIRVVARGGMYLDTNLTGMVIGHLGRKHERRNMSQRQLSRRESVVLQELANGKRNKEIATAMSITERTVKYHITSVFQKMKVKNRTEAVRLAVEKGMI